MAIKHWNGAQDNMSVEPCSPSMACDMEEGCSKRSRKMHDKEETASEASWKAVAKGKEKEVWRLEPEGEAEKPEVTVLENEAEGVSVNPEGESRHEQIRAKTSSKERGNGKKGLSNCAKRRGAEIHGNPAIDTFVLDRDVGHHVWHILNCCYCFSSSTYGGDWSLSVDGACIIAFSAQCTGL